MKHETHYGTHVLSEVCFFHFGVNVVFSARQNHLVQLMKTSSVQNRIINSVLKKKTQH